MFQKDFNLGIINQDMFTFSDAKENNLNAFFNIKGANNKCSYTDYKQNG